MPVPTNFLPAASNGDFKLRHWRSSSIRQKNPAALDLRATSNTDLDLNNWNHSVSNFQEGYTSIRDLLVSSPRSSIASPISFGSEIQIRNPLVKQAVYAYLQLTPSCTDSSSSSYRSRLFRRFLAAISSAFRQLQRYFGIIGRIVFCACAGESQ